MKYSNVAISLFKPVLLFGGDPLQAAPLVATFNPSLEQPQGPAAAPQVKESGRQDGNGSGSGGGIK